MKRAVTLALLATTLSACSEPLEFADWTIPVPEGARIVEYAAATEEDRQGNNIELIEDLVIGPHGDDGNYSFYNPTRMRVDAAGRIYVFDGGNVRIQVYDANGEYLRTLGAAGGGPGEFSAGRGGFVPAVNIAIAGDKLIGYDGTQSRISRWDTTGAYLDDTPASIRLVNMLTGLPDGSFIAVVSERDDEGSWRAGARYSDTGEKLREYVRLSRPGNFRVGRIGISNPTGEPQIAASRSGVVYASAGDEYQVLAVAPGDEDGWALRVAHQREAFTDEHRSTILDILASNVSNLDAAETDWPAHIGSISQLAVDGHGHLYVFEFLVPFLPPPDEIAVDVYSPEGERLFSGTMPHIRWLDVAGDFVYTFRTNDQTEEQEPVRYRLVEPFGLEYP